MRINNHFLLWYYAGGLKSILSIVWNYFRYTAYRFYFFGLLKTLFSPWKRDISFKTWRGFHPLKSLEALAENVMSRGIGAAVRIMTMGIGFIAVLFVAIIGTFLIALYVIAPAFVIVGLLALPVSLTLGGAILIVGISGIVMALVGFIERHEDEPETLDVTVLRKRRWFSRVINRLGFDMASFNQELLYDPEAFDGFLKAQGIEPEMFALAVAIERQAISHREQKRRFWLWENLKKTSPIGKGWSYAYTPRLDAYSLDLSSYDSTEYADAELVGRSEELKVATLVLERPTQNSLFLVGDPGIGKKTFVHHLARLIRLNDARFAALAGMRVLMFDLGRAVSDAVSAGEDVDNAVRTLFGEAVYAGNIILVIENLDLYFGGESGHHNLAPLFSEFLAYSPFRIIGMSTTNRYHAFMKTDEQSLKFIETVYLRETDEQETLDILIRQFEHIERQQVAFTLRGFQGVIDSAERYDWEWPFPERALDLAQEVYLYWQEESGDQFITPHTVNEFIGMKTGVPIGDVSQEEKDKLLMLEEHLHKRVVGQDEAVRQVAEAMRKARAGFGNGKRPLGSFIFFGPSGVGKTETVKAFAESYFGSEDKMIRLDMSEYQTQESVSRMIGSRETGSHGQLSVLAKEKPFSILLLDEIEKAYPKVLDLFLQILDEGYVTDALGDKANFRNMVIIATSNAGAPVIKDMVAQGADSEHIRKTVLDAIVKDGLFRLEFLGRFDGIVFFEPLKQSELEQVTALKLDAFAARLKKEKNITIRFAPEVIPKIVKEGFEQEFGSRSINRYIENTIEDTIVRKLIAGEIETGQELYVSGNDL